MNRFVLLVSLVSVLDLVSADCPVNGNNCARAVTASSSLAARRADCVAFQRCTVTPATSTSTTVTTTFTAPPTVTVTGTSTATMTTTVRPAGAQKRAPAAEDALDLPRKPALENLERRAADAPRIHRPERRQAANTPVTNCPTAVPTYASACTSGGSSIAYASACSCAGVLKAYTTISPGPVTTTTSTYTQTGTTATVTVHPTAMVTVSPLFTIRIGDSGTIFVDTIPYGADIVLQAEDTSAKPATIFQIVNGLLMSSGGLPIYVSTTFSVSHLYYGTATQAGDVEAIPANLGAFSSSAQGYLLYLDVDINSGSPRSVQGQLPNPPTSLLASDTNDNLGPLYAEIVG